MTGYQGAGAGVYVSLHKLYHQGVNLSFTFRIIITSAVVIGLRGLAYVKSDNELFPPMASYRPPIEKKPELKSRNSRYPLFPLRWTESGGGERPRVSRTTWDMVTPRYR